MQGTKELFHSIENTSVYCNVPLRFFTTGARLISWEVSVCVCPTPQAIKNHSREMKPK